MSRRSIPRLEAQLSRCSRCQTQQNPHRTQFLQHGYNRCSSSFSKSSATPGYYPPPEELKQPAYAQLTNRSIIRLQGPDVLDFLNGLLPAKLQSSSKTNSSPIFTAFLSAKGRILYEAFIYAPIDSSRDASWYIDTDSTSLSALFSHLKKHKLRSKFKLENISPNDLSVFYIWPSQEGINTQSIDLGGQDPRPLMGIRFLANATSSPILSQLGENGSNMSLTDYNIHRIISGHAEGPSELIPTSSLPQESNVDFDGGIDFHKGCYLGQELTIRTHHTGVVRKRVLPCQILDGEQLLPEDQLGPIFDSSALVHQPLSEANIAKMHAKGRSGRSTGKWLGGVGNIGLALCRLEMMTDIQLTAEGTSFDPKSEFNVVWEEGEADVDGKTVIREAKIQPFVPQWLRDSIQAGIQARSERSNRKRLEDSDGDEEVD